MSTPGFKILEKQKNCECVQCREHKETTAGLGYAYCLYCGHLRLRICLQCGGCEECQPHADCMGCGTSHCLYDSQVCKVCDRCDLFCVCLRCGNCGNWYRPGAPVMRNGRAALPCAACGQCVACGCACRRLADPLVK